MKTSTSLSPTWRNVLHAWPAGEERKYDWHTVTWGRSKTTVRASQAQVDTAVNRGYLVKGPVTPPALLTRTGKPIKPYVARGPNPKYEGPFPWGVDEHWRRIKASPARVTRAIANKLTNAKRSDPEYWEMYFRYPPLVSTRAELISVRQGLLYFFAAQKKSVNSRVSRRITQWGWMPRPLTYLFVTGQSLRLLFLDLLVQPVFRGEQVVRFAPVDGHQAEQEITRLVGGTGDVKEKYRHYIASEVT